MITIEEFLEDAKNQRDVFKLLFEAAPNERVRAYREGSMDAYQYIIDMIEDEEE